MMPATPAAGPPDAGGAATVAPQEPQEPQRQPPAPGLPAAPALPSIALPTGGGAIRGIGEKFGVDAVTGTASFTIPLPLTPGRDGFGPQLELSYDSGSGNGAFGLGWGLNLPAITRKTDKGIPRYDDAHESDVFVLSSAEDLVPAGAPERIDGYEVRRYRPRIESAFARIERWTRADDPADVHWRTLSPENVLTRYGAGPGSRITDPADERHIFGWLVCETRDTSGNVVAYEYAAEDDARSTAQRYLKRIRYGNTAPLLDAGGDRPRFLDDAAARDMLWHFTAVFDYGDHDELNPRIEPDRPWGDRDDPFSGHRSGFEIRTSRLCRRMLMFHSFPGEPSVGADALVGAAELSYSPRTDPTTVDVPVYTKLVAVTQARFRRDGAGYRRRALPPVEMTYSQASVQHRVRTVAADQLGSLPQGLDGRTFRWLDLNGEGIPGAFTEQGTGWYYLPNLSGATDGEVRFGRLEAVPARPNHTLAAAQLMDLGGDGRLDLAMLGGPAAGVYEHDEDDGWRPFRAFRHRLTVDPNDPNLRLADLDGDGLPDVLITEGDAIVWYPGLGRDGFGPAYRIPVPGDERRGPRVVFADATENVQLADMTGDGLSDIVRIRNGDVAYWPNLGYGRFGRRITLRNVPRFDTEDQFSPAKVRLGDLDGSGTTDLVYLHGTGPRLYFNQSGNALSAPHRLTGFPPTDNLVGVDLLDLLGNGTACLVWSSPLPGDLRRQLRYVDLMGAKPHLLTSMANNLGAETRVHYRSSTSFYLADKAAGRPWITRSPFPVHVVARTEVLDRVNRHRFTSRYAYHHQYFDAVEREPRGFGLVEQWDTEDFAGPADGSADVPPVYTRSWFHTGVYLGREHVSDYFAGLLGPQDRGEYYREPAWADDDAEARRRLLPDTVLPEGLTFDEEREACRALKGSLLRQEVYGLDGTAAERHPYTVVEQNFTIRTLQRRGANRHAVFLAHPRERLTYTYERNPEDPRVDHSLILAVDDFGHVLDEVTIAYGRRTPDPALPCDEDRAAQGRTLVTGAHNTMTAGVDTVDHFRVPLPADVRSYEITGAAPRDGLRFAFAEWTGTLDPMAAPPVAGPAGDGDAGRRRRLIDQSRVLYRPDDLGASAGDALATLPLGALEPRAVPGCTFRLCFDEPLLRRAFRRDGADLLDDLDAVLREGGYRPGSELAEAGAFPADDPPGQWWQPTDLAFLSPAGEDGAGEELAFARRHFFLPRRARDPFQDGVSSRDREAVYDGYDLVVVETIDQLGNRTTAGRRDADGRRVAGETGVDYRLLRALFVTDPNGNRAEAAVDTLGMLVATASMGKEGESFGDSLAGFDAAALDDPGPAGPPERTAPALIRSAGRRYCYDVFAYHRTRDSAAPQPPAVRTIVRETHTRDLAPGEEPRLQNTFSYCDGFGHDVQHKLEADPDPADPDRPRWISTGWKVLNNKGNPVRVYEPFFTFDHGFEFGAKHGVSTIKFYDPAQRVVATLSPDHSYEKVTFGAWHRTAWDRNDTVLEDPRTDPDVGGAMAGHFATAGPGWQTWYAQRIGGALGPREREAAVKSEPHARTPVTTYLDPLQRAFLTRAHNGFRPAPVLLDTRCGYDIEGNLVTVRDSMTELAPRGRVVARSVFDLIGRELRRDSMDTGTRWTLSDVDDKPLRQWDSRGHRTRPVYDALRRAVRIVVRGADPDDRDREVVTERTVYGEAAPGAERHNLRTRIYLHLDQSGAALCPDYDFKGNPLRSIRRIAAEYRTVVDWALGDTADADLPAAAEPALLPGEFRASSEFDALNRVLTLTNPAEDGFGVSVTRYRYNRSNLLLGLDLRIEGDTADGEPRWTPLIRHTVFDARGRRRRLERGNGVVTTFDYDPLTFRMTGMVTVRARGGRSGRDLQRLRYSYDPVGNITAIDDDAHRPVFFRNQRVDAGCDYTYDPLYRLVRATGREQLSRLGARPRPAGPRLPGVALPDDPRAVARYTEEYDYDEVGNLTRLRHRGHDTRHRGWRRTFAYAQHGSGDDPDRTWAVGNRLSTTTLSTHRSAEERYGYDRHGNLTELPHLETIGWNHLDQLRASQRQRAGDGRAERTYYVYDSSGARTRKVTERAGGEVRTDRIYLGGLEVVRRHAGAHRGLVRSTLAVSDGRNTIARVATRNDVDDSSPRRQVRHQIPDHLGSVTVEADGDGRLLSFEEYTPYGSTAYRAARSEADARKRDRFIGRERDNETGLYYVGARYYAPWLARWASADPAGLSDSANLYTYAGCDPVNQVDRNGAWKVQWKHVAIGFAVAAVTVVAVAVVVASAGTAAAPLLAGAAAITGVSEGTIVTGLVVAGAAVGTANVAKTTHELSTGRDLSGKQMSDEELSRKLGALPVDVVATVLGVKGISFGGGGGGGAAASEIAGVSEGGAAVLRGFSAPSFSLPSIVANAKSVAPALASAAVPVAMAMVGGGGGGGEPPPESNQPKQPPEKTSSQAPPPEDGALQSASPNAGATTAGPLASAPPPKVSVTNPGGANGATVGGSTTKNYRSTFFKIFPWLKGKVWVHHAIERQVAKLFPGRFTTSEINSAENLRGIPKEINSSVHLSQIRKIWNQFYKANPNATREELIAEANRIDDMFGACFNPPIRPPVSANPAPTPASSGP
ncbi:SpvB/TcaC N-terminal domain-containing protein [Actinoplanes sp. NPDC049118]|uniref:SpvB/TcaC N-terminal domain-containing protein n=1 Tax=Actinoplanes sp. NPDC049118 TaxID=3155769 RepID=UPI0033C92C1B